jgi:hypothetical protein
MTNVVFQLERLNNGLDVITDMLGIINAIDNKQYIPIRYQVLHLFNCNSAVNSDLKHLDWTHSNYSLTQHDTNLDYDGSLLWTRYKIYKVKTPTIDVIFNNKKFYLQDRVNEQLISTQIPFKQHPDQKETIILYNNSIVTITIFNHYILILNIRTDRFTADCVSKFEIFLNSLSLYTKTQYSVPLNLGLDAA